MGPGSNYLCNAVRPKVGVLQTVAGPRGQSRVVYQHKVPSLEGGRTSCAVTPSELTLSNVFQATSSQVRFEVWGLRFRVLDAFRLRGASGWGQLIS